MDKNILEILESYKSIQNLKKDLRNGINEVSSASPDLLGGKSVNIPNDGAHVGQSGWQSGNAWDIAAKIGDPVYAIASGTVQTFNDYGSTVVKKDGKKLFGIGFTVDSDNNLPDVYYAHLKDAQIKRGDHIECGQLLGYVMDFPDSSYDHVHIGVESGHNIREFLNSDGSLKCASGRKLDIQNLSQSNSTDSNETSLNNDKNGIIYDLVKNIIGGLTGLKEERVYSNFGKNVIHRSGDVIIPKDGNQKIYSPVNGVVNNTKYLSSCKNQIIIQHKIDGSTYYTVFCGITNPSVGDGKSIKQGTLLGTTDEDVRVSVYDSMFDREYISTYLNKENKSNKQTSSKPEYNKSKSYRATHDLADIFMAPLRSFEDKIDSNGEVIQKRWSRVGDKEQPEPWLNKYSATYNPEKQGKKLKENVEKIKRLL